MLHQNYLYFLVQYMTQHKGHVYIGYYIAYYNSMYVPYW